MAPKFLSIALLASVLAGMATSPPTPVRAQAGDGGSGPTLSLELNGLRQVETACRIIFTARNDLGSDLSSVSFETVLIDTAGLVDRLTVFDFQDLPYARMRVRQFDLAGTDCEAIGTVLINGVAACEGEGIDPLQCQAGLSVSSRTGVELAG